MVFVLVSKLTSQMFSSISFFEIIFPLFLHSKESNANSFTVSVISVPPLVIICAT